MYSHAANLVASGAGGCGHQTSIPAAAAAAAYVPDKAVVQELQA